MANKKISALTPQTGANTADGDLFHTVDISEAADSDKNKSLTKVELINTVLPVAASYTPVFSAGWGTMMSSQYVYTINNDVMTIWGEHTNGTVSATALTIGLPVGYQVATAIVNPVYLADFQRDTVGTARYGVIATGGDIFLEVSRLDAGAGAYVAMLGNAGMGTNEKQSFVATIHIESV